MSTANHISRDSSICCGADRKTGTWRLGWGEESRCPECHAFWYTKRPPDPRFEGMTYDEVIDSIIAEAYDKTMEERDGSA